MAFRGGINSLTLQGVTGWAWDDERPGVPVTLLVSVDGALVGRVLANRLRQDLVKLEFGDGRHAFDLPFAPTLAPDREYVVEVLRESDGLPLKNSPMTLRPTADFDEARQRLLTEVLGAPTDEEAVRDRLVFLEREATRLRRLYANIRDDVWASEAERRLSRADPEAMAGVAAPQPSADARRRALVIDKRPPQPERDGGSNALLSHIGSLKRLGYDVTFAPLTLSGDMTHLEAGGVRTCSAPMYPTVEDVLLAHRNRFDVVYLHRLDAASRYTALVRHHQPRARIVYSVADLAFLRMKRQAEIEQLPELEARAGRIRINELSACWAADSVITHSPAEAEVLRTNMRPGKVHVVPPAVAAAPTQKPFAERSGVAFIGSYGHQPNVDAAHLIARSLAPALRAEAPEIRIFLVGSDMPDIVARLEQDNLSPIGHVPELSGVFERVRLTVAPLAYGAGIKIKVLDSLSEGVPCVCTPMAAEGLDLPPVLWRHTVGEIDDLPRLIRALHDDEALNHACAEAGVAFIETLCGRDAVDALMRKALAG
ncbi:MAG: glycosyltransferase [Brevundimonas sp.]|nr:MAG: glycosyltransferase [Brevundimonas sp.]